MTKPSGAPASRRIDLKLDTPAGSRRGQARRRCTSPTEPKRVKSNPAFTVELLRAELGKLDALVASFIELSVTCARYRDYLKAIDLDEMERDMRRYQQLAERASDPEARTLAQKNLQVLSKRKDKYAEIRSYLGSAWGQLELIENTLELLADQVVTMRSPTELSGQLDELMDGVEAVRQTTRETDHLLQAVEP